MSKGTKQIRLGRVERFIETMEERLQALKERESLEPSPGLSGQVYELDTVLKRLKREFDL